MIAVDTNLLVYAHRQDMNFHEKGKITGPKIHDARVAAICLRNHVKILWSADRDFSRMEGLQVKNPLV